MTDEPRLYEVLPVDDDIALISEAFAAHHAPAP
jgi:hypothetical protein